MSSCAQCQTKNANIKCNRCVLVSYCSDQCLTIDAANHNTLCIAPINPNDCKTFNVTDKLYYIKEKIIFHSINYATRARRGIKNYAIIKTEDDDIFINLNYFKEHKEVKLNPWQLKWRVVCDFIQFVAQPIYSENNIKYDQPNGPSKMKQTFHYIMNQFNKEQIFVIFNKKPYCSLKLFYNDKSKLIFDTDYIFKYINKKQ
eukprot:210837_1